MILKYQKSNQLFLLSHLPVRHWKVYTSENAYSLQNEILANMLAAG